MVSEREMRKKYIIYIRAILTLVILLLGIYNYEYILQNKIYVIFYIIIVIISNFFFIYLPEEKYEGISLHYVVFLLDIILISLGAYWMGDMDFKFFMMMFLTVFISALSKSVKLSIIIAFVVNILYIFMVYSFAGESFDITQNINTLLNIPFIFIISLHGSYLAEKANEDIEEKERLKKANMLLSSDLKELNEEVEAILNFTARTYDSFREGIIIIDSQGMVKAFNRMCETIYNIRRTKVINMSITELDFLTGVKEAIQDLRLKKIIAYDKEVEITVDNITKKILLNTSYIRDKSENIIGYLCTVKLTFDNIKKSV